MCQVIMLPESDPLDPSPTIRRAIDPRDYEFRLPPAIALAVVLLLCLALWAALSWGLVTLVDVIYRAVT